MKLLKLDGNLNNGFKTIKICLVSIFLLLFLGSTLCNAEAIPTKPTDWFAGDQHVHSNYSNNYCDYYNINKTYGGEEK